MPAERQGIEILHFAGGHHQIVIDGIIDHHLSVPIVKNTSFGINGFDMLGVPVGRAFVFVGEQLQMRQADNVRQSNHNHHGYDDGRTA